MFRSYASPLAAALLLVVTLGACRASDAVVTTDEPAARLSKKPASCPGLPSATRAITLAPTSWEALPGARTTFVATNQNGVTVAPCALQWTSSDPAIVGVSAEGVATALRPGAPVVISARTVGARPAVATAAAVVRSPVARIEAQHYGVFVNGDTGTVAFRALDAAGVPLLNVDFTVTGNPAHVRLATPPVCGSFGCVQRLQTATSAPVADAFTTDLTITTPGSSASGRYVVTILPSAIDSLRALTFEESFSSWPRSIRTFPTLAAQLGQSVGIWSVAFWGGNTRSQSVTNVEYQVREGTADIVYSRGGWGDNVGQADYVSVVPRAAGTLRVVARFRRDDGTWLEHERIFNVQP